jgi:sigma-E factor negative regulatory protein RseB
LSVLAASRWFHGMFSPRYLPSGGLTALLLTTLTSAAVAQVPAAAPGKPAEASAWLERIRTAAQQRSFSGTLVYSAADVVSSSRVLRVGTADAVIERVEVLDGHQQRSFRHNDDIQTIWPTQRVVTHERRSVVNDAAGLPQLESRLLASYEVRHLGDERIVGRQAAVLMLKPRDEWRFAQRLWVDAASGLLLRADVLSTQGHVLETVAFSNVELDIRPTRELVTQPKVRTEGFRTVQLHAEAASLEAAGWVAERLPAGFKLVGCVQRPVANPKEAASNRAQPALQAVFSDGLARVSVFIEPYDPAKPRPALMTNLGATHTLMKPMAERWWITVMGDVPVATLKLFAVSVSRKS